MKINTKISTVRVKHFICGNGRWHSWAMGTLFSFSMERRNNTGSGRIEHIYSSYK